MVGAADGVYGVRVIPPVLRSFWAEPPAPDPPPPAWWDWLLVAVIVVGGTVEVALREDVFWPVVGLALTVAPALTLPWRRTHPLLVTAVVVAGGAAAELVAYIGGGQPAELSAAVYVLLLPYALFRWGSGRVAMLAMAFAFAPLLLVVAMTGPVVEALAGILFFAVPAELGALVRSRAVARTRALDQVRFAEREQLARELHDTVAHHVSAIAIRAQAGLTVAPSRPEAAAEALEVIEEAASRTLDELRTMVGALRDDAEPQLAPQRGVADLARLADRPGEGPLIEVDVGRDVGTVRPLVGAALYRIAQESVTNAVRHAREARRIEVRLWGEDDRVRLTVRDDGRAGAAGAGTSTGYGLVGMTERATLLGGTLEAGPGPGGGWEVTAVLPRDGGGT